MSYGGEPNNRFAAGSFVRAPLG